MNSWRNSKGIQIMPEYAMGNMPDAIKNWLAQLVLLGDVPLAYLTPDENLLPAESIRFFYIDPEWTAALADGATSIGIHTTAEALRCAMHSPILRKDAAVFLRYPRMKKMHPNHRRVKELAVLNADDIQSGFIMRSDLVSSWRGIEARGFSGSAELDILRMEVITDKLLICIFDGEITTVQLLEPREALHFGTRSSKREIEVRRIDKGHEGEPLYESGSTVSIKIPSEQNGRLKVTELVSALSKKLGVSEQDIGSPELALEMLSVAGRCEFKKEGGNAFGIPQ